MNKKLDVNLLNVTYNAVIKEINKKTGEIKSEEKIHNVIVASGIQAIRDFIGGASTSNFSHIAIGEGTTGSQTTDIELENEIIRELASITYPENNQVKYEKIFTFGSGEEYSITETGLFNSETISGSIMLNRLVFSTKSVDSDTDLSVSITISIS